MPITESDLATLRNGNVVTTSGDKIGSIGQIYLDDETGDCHVFTRGIADLLAGRTEHISVVDLVQVVLGDGHLFLQWKVS